MGDVFVFFTTQGSIIGELVESLDISGDHVTLKSPAFLVNQGTSVQFVPVDSLVEGSEFKLLAKSLLFVGGHVPIKSIEEKYREIFGAGIQIVPSMSGIQLTGR